MSAVKATDVASPRALMEVIMSINLEGLKTLVERTETRAKCHIDLSRNQIYVGFDNRPDVEIALLVPLQQREIAKGHLDDDDISELLFTVRRIANA